MGCTRLLGAQSVPSTQLGPRLRAMAPTRPCPLKAAMGIQGASVGLGLRGPSPTARPVRRDQPLGAPERGTGLQAGQGGALSLIVPF